MKAIVQARVRHTCMGATYKWYRHGSINALTDSGMHYETQCHVQATSGQLQRCLDALAKHELLEQADWPVSPGHPRGPARLRHSCTMSRILQA